MFHNRYLCWFLLLALSLMVLQTRTRTLKSPDRFSGQGSFYRVLGYPLARASSQHGTSPHKGVVLCDICPDEKLITPCTCVCHNTTSADIKCGAQLTSCDQLTAILNVATPVPQYLRLVVQDTDLECILKNDIWGPATFQEIIMRGNQFCTVDNHAFVHFNSTLKILNLEMNLLQNIFFSTLNDQPLVEKILLSNNQLRFIPGEGFIALNKLREIRFDHNHLTSIQANTFMLLPSLELLDLSFNQIESLEKNSLSFQNRFLASRNLRIVLTMNNITTIPKNVISGVENVTLDLRHNSIQTLPEDRFRSVLENTNYKAKILISDNNITCDTDLCWIVGNKTIMKAFDNFRCVDPPVNLYDLTGDYLGCNTSPKTL